LIELLTRVAWKANELQQAHEPRSLTALHIKNLLDGVGLSGDALELVERGVLLTLSVSLTDADRETHFVHKSFGEFLVARYWLHRLTRIAGARAREREIIEEELYGSRLLQESDESMAFLIELCADLPDRTKEAIVEWAQDTFNDERMSADTIGQDQRYALREAALTIGSSLAVGGLRAESEVTLLSLLAVLWGAQRHVHVIAPGLVHPKAQLSRANLAGANLGRSKLTNASLVGADL